MNNWTIFTAETIFNFGQYQGKSLDQVAQMDAPYIFWCVGNIEKFLISEEDLIDFSNKYEKTITTFCSPTNDEFERSYNFYIITNDHLNFLKKKWKDYEEYIEMMDNKYLALFVSDANAGFAQTFKKVILYLKPSQSS